jgi:hypothetical protein
VAATAQDRAGVESQAILGPLLIHPLQTPCGMASLTEQQSTARQPSPYFLCIGALWSINPDNSTVSHFTLRQAGICSAEGPTSLCWKPCTDPQGDPLGVSLSNEARFAAVVGSLKGWLLRLRRHTRTASNQTVEEMYVSPDRVTVNRQSLWIHFTLPDRGHDIAEQPQEHKQWVSQGCSASIWVGGCLTGGQHWASCSITCLMHTE